MTENKKQRIIATILIVMIFSSFQNIAKAETIDDVLQSKDCNIEYGTSLSVQIFTFAQKIYSCNFLNIESLVNFEYSNQVGILNALEKTTAVEIEKAFSTTSSKLDLEYGFIGLVEYFFYTQFAAKNLSCGDSETLRRLGSSYNDCKLCKGTSFSTKNSEQIKLIKNIDTLTYDDSDNIFTSNSGLPLNTIIAESFQLLWNCNNPEDQLIVTGYFDESTEKRLRNTNIDGFDKVCMNCQVKNCGVCTNNYAQCLQCKDGYYMQDGICNACTTQNCSKCSKNNDSSTTCNVCRAGFFLLDNQCVETCPPEYKTTKTQCLLCRPGTYIKDESCEECSPFCRECSGPNANQCKECFDGFVYEFSNGCSVCPEGQQCGKIRCTSSQYRQLVYPYLCGECFQNCLTCKGPLQNDCLTCKNNYSQVNGFCLNPSFKAKKFIDSRTKTEKECNFSCDECIDSTDLCTKCNAELNYFVKVGDRLKCYNRCPLYYVSTKPNQDGFIECLKGDDFTDDIQSAEELRTQAKNRCLKQQFFDVETKKCARCMSNCISCNDEQSCIECSPGFYFNAQINACSPCNPSCKKCSGPLFKDCLTCQDITKLYPDQSGVCNSNMDIKPVEIRMIPQTSLKQDSMTCNSQLLSGQSLYSAQFSNLFSNQDAAWSNVQMTNSNQSCTFSEFQKRFKSISKNNRSCTDQEVSQSTIGQQGEALTIYSILLANSNASINGQSLNPKLLTDFANKQNLFSLKYMYNQINSDFSCSQLQCRSQIDSFIDSLSTSTANKVVSLKKGNEMIFQTTNNTPVNCFDDSQQINTNLIDTIQKTLLNAQSTLSSSSKQYFLITVCGKDIEGKQVIKTMLVQKYSDNSFFEAINVNSPITSQVESFTIYGASSEINQNMKKCNPSFSNSFSSYVVQKLTVIKIEESESITNKSELRFQQYNQRADIQPINVSKCSCPSTNDYIFSNENQGQQFITVVTPQNKLISGSINAYDIKHILKNHYLDINDMKQFNLSITKIEAQSIYNEYIKEITKKTNECYNIKDSVPQCYQNILADIVFSNRQNCISQKEISEFISQLNFKGLKQFISTSNWCTLNSQRCLKAIQVIKGCL